MAEGAYKVAAAIAELLEAERTALSARDTAKLGVLADRKEGLIALLEGNPLPQDAVARLRIDAARNEALLGAHAAGLRAAIRRIEALARPAAPLASYDNSGAPATIGPQIPAFERRR